MTEPAPRKTRVKRAPGTTTAAAAEAPRAGYARAVADIVPAIGDAAFRRFGFVQSAVVSRWGEIVGERYAGVSTPESIRFPAGKRQDGVLSLVVESAHAPMMQHVAPVIVERVNRFFGYAAVGRVAIRQGAAAKRPARRPARQPDGPVPAELGESLKAIADPELKAVLESLARGLVEAPPVVPLKLGKIG
ncbi:DUF721 domain-containing protein [Sphingomonas quercus]|nr:DciA family protein [Sphingomonas quercus]